MYCKNCGVELESDMQNCPLCGQQVNKINDAGNSPKTANAGYSYSSKGAINQADKKHIWAIISITLLSATIATFIIDFILNKHITWSQYPVAICLIIFSYISLVAFVKWRFFFEIMSGFIISSILLSILDFLTSGTHWALKLAIPLLFSVNLVVIAFTGITRVTKHKGINLIAWGFIAAGVLCIATEAILSLFKSSNLHLQWSIIVISCIIPVAIVLFYMHGRLKKGRNLERTFHI